MIGYFATLGGISEAYNYVKEIATYVTHAYNKGKEVVNTVKYTYAQTEAKIQRMKEYVKKRYGVPKRKKVHHKAHPKKHAYKRHTSTNG